MSSSSVQKRDHYRFVEKRRLLQDIQINRFRAKNPITTTKTTKNTQGSKREYLEFEIGPVIELYDSFTETEPLFISLGATYSAETGNVTFPYLINWTPLFTYSAQHRIPKSHKCDIKMIPCQSKLIVVFFCFFSFNLVRH